MHESDLELKDIERYSRQIIVPGIGITGQSKIQQSRVLIVGCGGLGCPLILYLSTCGIATIGMADHDIVEIHNLQRQVLFKESELGEFKVECAAQYIKNVNSSININVYKHKIDQFNCESIILHYDIIVDCTDSIEARYVLSDFTHKHNKEFICASVIRWEGHLYVFRRDGPCYRCLFPKIKSEITSCDENGIVGPICGVFGSLLGLEVIKCILGLSETKFVTYNGITDQYRTFKLRNKNKKCPACTGQIYGMIYEKVICLTNQVTNMKVDEINWEDVMVGDYMIIDVRNRVQYDMFRIKNSLSTPYSTLETVLDSLKNINNIAVLCKRGIISIKACALLAKHGVKAVSINGGIDEYKKLYLKN